jgi:bifunctional NMN adenylyltransferase/nudix hydrolase
MMQSKKYDFAVYIGRFQPFHIGHRGTIQQALHEANHVIVLVGSADSPRSSKNPFTFNERADMIRREFHDERLHIEPLHDFTYRDEAWIAEVGKKVQAYVMDYGTSDSTVALYGHIKDDSSHYLDCFKQWKTEDTGKYADDVISATDVRKMYYEGMSSSYYNNVLPKASELFLAEFKQHETFKQLVREYEHARDYDPTIFNNPIMVTTDAVVIQSGHVLLIQRKDEPGKGLWAMPGGHLNNTELIVDGMLRELDEETNIRVPEDVLRGSIAEVKVIDSTTRSNLCRVITHVYNIKLKNDKDLPRVTAGDDAKDAKWVPLAEFKVMRPCMFEDHWHIINMFV